MDKKHYFLLEEVSQMSLINNSFLKGLIEYELIAFKQELDNIYIVEDDINEIERLFRLHNDLGLGFESLDIVNSMLNRINELEQEVNYLKSRLSLYE